VARRYRSNNSESKGQCSVIIIAALVVLALFIIKIILVLLPFAVIGFIAYKYFQWQKARLLVYDNDWNKFYQEELKFKIHLWGSISALLLGSVIASLRPWVGIPIILVGLLTFPNIQNWLSQKFNEKYNIWTKGTVIASLLTFSFAANGVYSDISDKRNAEQARIEKIKSDEIERVNKEKQILVDSANHLVQIASNNIKAKKYNIAEDILKKAILLDPENQNAIYYRGLIYQKKGKYSKALEEYDKVFNVPDLQVGELEYQKGQCYLSIGKKEEALSALQNSGNLGFEKGSQLYQQYRPKPKQTLRSKNNTSSTSSFSSGTSRSSGGCLAGQCIASTKKGNRCLRRTTNCSGRCWQH
jgi:tetratricopeptide (TPR) repeat protein